MNLFLSYILCNVLLLNCNSLSNLKSQNLESSQPAKKKIQRVETFKYSNNPYDSLIFLSTEQLKSGNGTKSVIFNSDMTKMYALNLEGMSIYEYSQKTKSIIRIFKFKPTKGIGWDYDNEKPIPSFEEKPVEACISNNDSILWVSLHNAGGIVPIFISENSTITHNKKNNTDKLIYFTDGADKIKDSTYVPLIETGKTPKVIIKSANDHNLLVSNWHSYSISVLEINPLMYPFAKVIKTIPVKSIPRGMIYNDKIHESYVAIMGGATLDVIDNDSWTIKGELNVASNPRHLVQGDSGRIFVSYNKISTIACIDPLNNKTLFYTPTSSQPRTIAISKNKKFLFVTCYSGNKVEVFKINSDNFEKIASLDCLRSPVGIDLFEDDNKLEAWVCSYNGGLLSIFTFKKK